MTALRITGRGYWLDGCPRPRINPVRIKLTPGLGEADKVHALHIHCKKKETGFSSLMQMFIFSQAFYTKTVAFCNKDSLISHSSSGKSTANHFGLGVTLAAFALRSTTASKRLILVNQDPSSAGLEPLQLVRKVCVWPDQHLLGWNGSVDDRTWSHAAPRAGALSRLVRNSELIDLFPSLAMVRGLEKISLVWLPTIALSQIAPLVLLDPLMVELVGWGSYIIKFPLWVPGCYPIYAHCFTYS